MSEDRDKASEHAAKAEELLRKTEKSNPQTGAWVAGQATAHAALALYHQREAEKE